MTAMVCSPAAGDQSPRRRRCARPRGPLPAPGPVRNSPAFTCVPGPLELVDADRAARGLGAHWASPTPPRRNSSAARTSAGVRVASCCLGGLDLVQLGDAAGRAARSPRSRGRRSRTARRSAPASGSRRRWVFVMGFTTSSRLCVAGRRGRSLRAHSSWPNFLGTAAARARMLREPWRRTVASETPTRGATRLDTSLLSRPP